MVFRPSPESRELTAEPLVLKAERHHGGRWLLVAALVVGLVSAGYYVAERFGLESPFDRSRVVEREAALKRLEAENRELTNRAGVLEGELERALLDLEIAAVTQQELERQIAVLNEQLGQVKEELEFLKSAGEAD